MLQLLAVVEYINATEAICMKCGKPANHTQRTFESEERGAVGGAGIDQVRCRPLLQAACRRTDGA